MHNGTGHSAIDMNDSVKKWNGTYYPIKEWNMDLTLEQAFRSSCIWYFRQLVDSLNKTYVQEVLDRLEYGNRDISEWEGSGENLIFPNMSDLKELNGFWQISSLEISPMEQVRAVRQVFEQENLFSENDKDTMKSLVLSDASHDKTKIYGKTGSGKTRESRLGWYVGFFENEGDTVYFAVLLDYDSAQSAKAKEIAHKIIDKLITDS